MHLLDLPPELLIHALSFLDAATLEACAETCTLFESIIQSPALQYAIACGISGVSNNPEFHLDSLSDRLRILRDREAAFARGKPTWKREISVPFQAAGLYELTGGLFWLGEQSRKALRWIPLPTEPDEIPQWQRLEVVAEHETSAIIDFGLAVEEHDLVMVAKYSWTGSDPSLGYVSLHPYCISTGAPHPLAKGPIVVLEQHRGQPRVSMEIVGDVVVFMTGTTVFGWNPPADLNDAEPDRFFVFEWRTGVLRKEMNASPKTYYGFAFITPDIIMLPNKHDAVLELWDISTKEASWTAPVLALQLPILGPRTTIQYWTTRCEPNPAIYTHGGHPSRFPFSPTTDDAITVFHITFQALDPNTGAPASGQYLFFIKRRSFLEMLQKHVIVPPSPGDAFAGPYGIPYSAWDGPAHCMWLPARGLVTDWITTTAGQRAMILSTNGQVYLFDFNVDRGHVTLRDHIVEESQRELQDESKQPQPRGVDSLRRWVSFLPMDDVAQFAFGQRVGSRLPGAYRQIDTSTLGQARYAGASLDEARIIGLKKDGTRRIIAVDVLFFG
ncbi:F-box domain-containing protein [Mycena chlorophos]|uniref:F-box domain-containing protein n=1 Tax=Mycena chlorophos TaxID=658473 RepID=A0A8H6WJ09_MYCCL|nr:F-box domain-containing protein [Mycena chlorophos]